MNTEPKVSDVVSESKPALEVITTSPNTSSATTDTPKERKTGKSIILLIVVIASLFALQILTTRLTPTSEFGQLRGVVTTVMPQVSGDVIEVLVTPHQQIQANDVLVQINPDEYEQALVAAEQNVTKAGQNMGSLSANVRAAEAKMSSAQANFESAKIKAELVQEMLEKGEMVQKDVDNANTALSDAENSVGIAQLELAQFIEQMGAEGGSSTNVKSALLALEQAQIDLENTSICAVSDGIAGNVTVQQGDKISPESTLMTYVAADAMWIEAHFSENTLRNIKVGDNVAFSLGYAPGEVFEGKVSAIDYNAHWQQTPSNNNAVSQPQHFPVTIEFDADTAQGVKLIGGQADVMVYTSDNAFVNLIGKAWFSMTSWL